MPSKTQSNKTGSIKVTLVKSLIGAKQKQIATAHALGLKKIGDNRLQPDNEATKGKIFKIKHLVKCE